MAAVKAGASIDEPESWCSLNWEDLRADIRRLQMRIAKAVMENRWNKVRILQHLLTSSFYAKLLAVKRVTSNKGKKTPGVDGLLWKTNKAKWQAARSLRRRGYKPQPLKRIYIPKKNGKLRPLSIPTMKDRAMQALHKMALSPVAETKADPNSYGFREGRSCADAIAAGFNALSKPNSATWVFEADIKGCFDNISYSWMLENIPVDKVVLKKWLNSGYVEGGIHYSSRKGTPQGGIISPTLSNMVLDGLETAIHKAVPRRSRVNFVRYADDFIVTAKSRRLLVEQIRPIIEEFLAKRGLSLSQEKTKITHIRDGFTFLGQTFQKHGNTLHITPSREGVHALLEKVGTTIRNHVSAPTPVLIKKLNEMLKGWANYHRFVVASEIFGQVDTYVFKQLWRMLARRHSNKSKGWLIQKYWTASGKKSVFAVSVKIKPNPKKVYQVIRVSSIGIKRYIKIKADANPYLQEYSYYFYKRKKDKSSKILPAMSAREVRALARE